MLTEKNILYLNKKHGRRPKVLGSQQPMLFTSCIFLTIIWSCFCREISQFHVPGGRDEFLSLWWEHQLQAFNASFYGADATFVLVGDLWCAAPALFDQSLFLSDLLNVPVVHFEELERQHIEGFGLHSIKDVPSEVSNEALVGPLFPLHCFLCILIGAIWVLLSSMSP